MDANVFSIIDSSLLCVDAALEIDKEHDTFICPILTSMHTYQMEFDLQSPLAELPRCFAREFGNIHRILQLTFASAAGLIFPKAKNAPSHTTIFFTLLAREESLLIA
ncbi:hypothetical protein P8452_75866 [Trifolium repens]|nr:hypothetical protein P8452_75866 [Trifolium repens]